MELSSGPIRISSTGGRIRRCRYLSPLLLRVDLCRPCGTPPPIRPVHAPVDAAPPRTGLLQRERERGPGRPAPGTKRMCQPRKPSPGYFLHAQMQAAVASRRGQFRCRRCRLQRWEDTSNPSGLEKAAAREVGREMMGVGWVRRE